MPTKKAIILIDGSNFYFKLKDLNLQNLLTLDLSKFVESISTSYKIVHCTYFIGKIRTDGTKKTQTMFNKQRKLLAHLNKHNIKYSLGYLMKNDNIFHEKGVDVNIAVNILIAAYENICDHIIIVSSDTDLIPAIQKTIRIGKTVEYIGFFHKPSLAMIAKCSESKLLKKDDITKFMKSLKSRK